MSTYSITMPNDEGVKYEQFRYPAGEVQVRLKDSELDALYNAEVIEVRAFIRDGDIMPLALLTDALQNHNLYAQYKLTLPYLPYSRADRRFTTGDCHALEVFGSMLDCLMYDKVTTLDVHSKVARQCISNLNNVEPLPAIESAIKSINPTQLAILLPDAGASRYDLHSIKGAARTAVLQAHKVRDPKTGKLSGFTVPTRGELAVFTDILIVDDICDGGGTFIGIAEELKKVTNAKLWLYVTHGIFSKGKEIFYPLFERVFTTDSFADISGAEEVTEIELKGDR